MPTHLRKADRIFVDETRAPVLDPGRGATKTGWFRVVVSDDRGHGGTGPPIVPFHYDPGRGKARTVIGNWIRFHNHEPPHSALGGRTPVEAHLGSSLKAAA